MHVRFIFPNHEIVETEGYDQLNLLAHGQLIERSLQSRCGGHAECATCRVIVESGQVTPMREAERELLARAGVTDPRVRLACQAFPEAGGPLAHQTVVIRVPAEKFIDARGQRRR